MPFGLSSVSVTFQYLSDLSDFIASLYSTLSLEVGIYYPRHNTLPKKIAQANVT